MKNGRYELKFLITYADYIELYNKLKHIMTLDEHSPDDNEYFIRSLYFDDIYSTSYFTKVNGDNNRRKYRIRIYNMSDKSIKFERKDKQNNKVDKTSFLLKRFQYEQLYAENYDVLHDIDHPLAREIYTLHHSRALKPVVVVDYNRTALLHPLSNTRITFDKHLRAGLDSYDIFDEIYTYPIFPNDSVILEVKYDNYLPEHISSVLTSVYGQKISLSKFCMCREKLAHMNFKKSIFI